MTYAAWLSNIGETGRGALATYRRQIIVADTAEQIREAFGHLAEPVELHTIEVHDWLKQDSLALDMPARSAVPTVDELRMSSRWRPLEAPPGAEGNENAG